MNATIQFVPDIGAGWTCWASSPTRITGVPAMQQDGSFTLACTDSGGDTHTVTYFVRDGKPHMTEYVIRAGRSAPWYRRFGVYDRFRNVELVHA